MAKVKCDLKLVRWWQRILGLQDWRIDVEFLSDADFTKRMNKLGRAGYCDCTLARQWASILVNLEPEDGTSPEHTLIHEEYHVLANDLWMGINRVIDDFITDSKTQEYLRDELGMKMEILVDKTAEAFMRLKNHKQRARSPKEEPK